MKVQDVTLTCDGCRVASVTATLPVGTPHLPVVAYARSLGWTVDVGAESLCPGCRKRRRP
jgi:hypothetical protein